jgi:calcium-dependent protein kinase
VFESTAADAELKLIDFGLSRHFSADEVMHVPVGTPYSIAPEVLTGSYTSACDLWSLGMSVSTTVYSAIASNT